MFPDLSYILHYLFGTSPDNVFSIVKTFGLFLAIAILVAAWLLEMELRRKEKEGLLKPIQEKITIGEAPSTGEIVTNGLIGFILGFKILFIFNHFDLFQMDPAGIIFSSRGSIVGGIAGALFAGGYRYWQKNRQKLAKPEVRSIDVYPHQRIGDITILSALSGVVGAKLFDALEHIDQLLKDPVGTLFSGGGLAIYGGLIVAFTVMYFYLKKKGIPPIHVMDAVAPALIIAYGIGRIGCQLSGDGDWGIVNTDPSPPWWVFPEWMWSFDYPHNVLNEGVAIEGCQWAYCSRLEEPVFPTPAYETILAFIIGAVLWFMRTRIKIPGMLFFIYLIFNGTERFFIEKIRVNIRYDWGAIHPTQAEVISTALVIIGISGVAFLWQRSGKRRQIAGR